jgi:hypothetical protein
MNRFLVLCLLGVSLGCTRQPKHEESRDQAKLSQEPATRPSTQPRPNLVEPTVLVEMPVSAYGSSLALDEEAVYLMTPNAAYRLIPGQPAHGIELDLGIGPVMTRDAFVYWHAGAIFRSPKAGGQTKVIAKFPHEPQYFVTSGANLAWVDRNDDRVYTIQTLQGRDTRVLVKSETELSALNMVGDAVFFVHKAQDSSWRIGRVQLSGGEPVYTSSKIGPTPAMLTGSEHITYWDLKTSDLRVLPLTLEREDTWLKDLVCSPNYEAKNIYCGCVEGLFEVQVGDHKPNVLSHGRQESITFIRADSKRVVWIVDKGPNRLAVNMLPIAS